MDADERDIVQFLKTWGSTFVGAKEIARRAGQKKRFYDDPDWAKQVLMRMADHGVLESDSSGRYRIKPVSRRDKNKRLIAPDITKILQDSGMEVEDSQDAAPDKPDDEL